MEIEFKLSEEDYINFNVDHTKKSPTMRKNVTFIRILGPVVFLIAPFVIISFSEIPLWYWITLFGIASILWLIYYPRHFDWDMRRKMKKMLQEGNNENLFKEIKIILTKEGIIQKNKTGESFTKWDDVDSVDETDDYIYIYNSSISAFIIPKRAFKDENARKEFFAEILEHYRWRWILWIQE